jgi:hypothetical protein
MRNWWGVLGVGGVGFSGPVYQRAEMPVIPVKTRSIKGAQPKKRAVSLELLQISKIIDMTQPHSQLPIRFTVSAAALPTT